MTLQGSAPFGLTRSRRQRDHAFMTPESHVAAPLPGWSGAKAVTQISPHLGAAFTQYLVLMAEGGTSGGPAPGVERFLLVLDGQVRLESVAARAMLEREHFAYVPPDVPHALRAETESRLLVLERRYVSLPGHGPPEGAHYGPIADVEGAPFLGDPDARLQTLLPDDPRFDMAMNVFTFAPGACLPLVEMHVMEHGLYLLEGAGVYRLGDDWYPVQAGDAIWMAPYCPQWFAAVGKTAARYIYYKDAPRDPLEPGG